MNKPGIFKVGTILAPILCCVIAGSASTYELRRLHALQGEWTDTTNQINSVNAEIKQIEGQPREAKFPAAEQTSSEQPGFLNTLRAYADASSVQLVRWSNTAAPNAAADQSGVTQIASAIEVAGTYNNTRQFLYSLLRSPRLYNMNELHFTRGSAWPTVHLTFTLTRYTAPAGKPGLNYHYADDVLQPHKTSPICAPGTPGAANSAAAAGSNGTGTATPGRTAGTVAPTAAVGAGNATPTARTAAGNATPAARTGSPASTAPSVLPVSTGKP